MRIFATLIVVCAILSLCVGVVAQDAPAPPTPDTVAEQAPAPPSAPDAVSEPTSGPPPAPDAMADPAPAPPRANANLRRMSSTPMAPPHPPMGPTTIVRRVMVGPADSQGTPRRERGTVTIMAMPPRNVQVASVEIFCNSALIGQKAQGPYEVQFNTTTVGDGTHVFKAVGLDASSKQVWTASTKVDVRNTTTPTPNSSGPGTRGSQTTLAPPPGPRPSPTPMSPVAPSERRAPKVVTPSAPPFAAPNAAKTAPPPAPTAGSLSLSKTYTSAKYGFSVGYPAGWIAKDQTASMRPRKSGNGWIVFAPVGKKANLAINVRRVRLNPSSDADAFAKYNPYVTKWERKSVGDSQAFATTTTVSPKKMIHRLIMIKNGYAWMLNCTDTSGQPSDGSQQLFGSVVDSLKILVPAKSKAINVIEVK
jgi:hypothetical protein